MSKPPDKVKRYRDRLSRFNDLMGDPDLSLHRRISAIEGWLDAYALLHDQLAKEKADTLKEVA